MKKRLILCLAIPTVLLAQELRHEAKAVNVEVPVRVFQGDRFVEDLALGDFEVTEDGKPQKVEAVYLIKKAAIERQEETRPFHPVTARRFYLFFELSKYDPRLAGAVRFFLNNVLVPEDALTIVSPLKTYALKAETLRMMTRDQVADQLIGILRRDIVAGNGEYRSAIEDLSNLAAEIRTVMTEEVGPSGESEVDVLLIQYAALLDKIENIRSIDQGKLLEFAKILKDRDGQKDIFLFYQSERIPTIDRRTLQAFAAMNMDRPGIVQTISDIFDFYKREIRIKVDDIKRAYADSSIAIHFLFLATPAEDVPGLTMEEHSEDVFAPFLEMARATGGFAESSSNLESLMKNAAQASETYYLLYYSPAGYKPDGKFRTIRVRVKGRDIRVSHRAGYIAD